MEKPLRLLHIFVLLVSVKKKHIKYLHKILPVAIFYVYLQKK